MHKSRPSGVLCVTVNLVYFSSYLLVELVEVYLLFISRTGSNGTGQHVSLVSCFFHLGASVAEVVFIEVNVFNLGELF